MSLRTPELWERALDARRAEKVAAAGRKVKDSGRTKAGPAPLAKGAAKARRSGAARCRKYPPAKVGDLFGVLRVVTLLPRGSTSNERVEVECPRGHRRESFVFNLRKRPTCRRCPGSLR